MVAGFVQSRTMRMDVSARTELEAVGEEVEEVEAVVGGEGGWESESGRSWRRDGWEDGGV